ncbi:unnamed protein product [Closterium sp. NIES-53]
MTLPQLHQLFQEERIKGLRIKGEPKKVGSCETCLTSKFSRFPFHSAVGQSSDPVELLHVDLVGPMKLKGDGGALYSMTMVDDYIRLTWTFPLAKKSDAARFIIEEWLPMVERESGKRVKAICSDRGGEFLGAEFRSCLKRHGIKKQLTTAYTPQSNGVAERANRTIIEGGRTILVDSGLPLRFWPLTIRHATVIKNRVLTHVGGQHWVPMEKWSGKKPLVDMLRVFGCMGLVHVPKERRDKLQAVAVWAVHLGLARGSKGWLMWDPKSNTVFTTRGSKFMEGLMFKEWSEWGRSKVTSPLGIEVGMNDPLLIPIELSSSSELTEVSHDLGGAEGEAAEAPTLRLLLAAAAVCGWKVEQMDVKTAFLYGVVDEEIYMKQPEGYDDGSGRVCRLNKAIYGLKQAPRCWYARLVEALEALGFKVSGCDESLFMTKGEVEKVFLLVYVDDILLFSPSLERIKEVQGKLEETFQCKALGPVGYYLGLHLHLDEEEGEVLEYELQRRFQSMVGSLMYASINTRPDIAFSVSQLARVVSRPLQEHLDDILLFSPSLERIKEVQGKLKETFQCKALGPVGYYLGLHVERDEVKGWLRLHQHKYRAAMGDNYGLEEGRSVRKEVKKATISLHYINTTKQLADFLTKRLAEHQHWSCATLCGMSFNYGRQLLGAAKG